MKILRAWRRGDAPSMLGGAAAGVLVRSLGLGCTLVFNVLIARRFGAAGTGIFYLAMTVVMLAAMIGRMGMDNPLMRIVATGSKAEEWGRVRGVVWRAAQIGVSLSLLTTLGVFIGAPVISRFAMHSDGLTLPLRWFAIAITPTVIVILVGEMLKGVRRPATGLLLQFALVPALAATGLIFLGPRFGVLGAVWAYLGGTVVAAGVAIALWLSIVPDARRGPRVLDPRELIRDSLPLVWVSGLDKLMSWAAVFALGFFSGPAAVGIFSTAWRIARVISFFLVAVNSVVAPTFAVLHNEGAVERLRAAARSARRLSAAMAAPFCAVLLFMPGKVMGVFGEEFLPGATVLVVLTLAQTVNVGIGPMNKLLLMSEGERVVRNIYAASVALEVALLAALIPALGANGAALATGLALVCLNLMSVVSAEYRLRAAARKELPA